MKRLLLAAVSAATLVGFAQAADLKVPPAYKAPALAAQACWFCGIYVGGHAGYGWDVGGGSALIGTTPVDFNAAPQGFVGGLNIGVGYQFSGPFYLGLEGDGSIGTLSGTTHNPGFIGSIDAKNRWLASLRARGGFVVDRTLLFVTGGWGWGSSEFTTTALTEAGSVSQSLTADRNGFVFGGGLEYALTKEWHVRGEFLRYDFNSVNATMFGVFPATASSRVDVARGVVTYNF